jgi:hypothetical protein
MLAAACSMLFHVVSRFMLYAGSFFILLVLYVSSSIIFLRGLCLMLCCSVMSFRSELNPCFMLIYSGYCSYLMLLHAIYCVISYAANPLCFSILYAAPCCMQIHVFANPFFMLLHAWCRCMLNSDLCFIQIHAVCRSILYADPCLILFHPWLCCFMPRCFWRTADTSLDHTMYLTVSGFAILCLK